MTYQQQKVLIIGGSGFIGTHLTKKLLQLKSLVTVMDKHQPQVKGVNFLKLSLTSRQAVTTAVKKKFTLIFNLAGQSGTVNFDPIKGFRANCLGALNLLEAVHQYSPQSVVVFSNSRQEYGRAIHLPVNEQHPTNPTNHYGVQKLAVTNYALFYHRSFKLKTIVLRTSNLFGPLKSKKKISYNIVSQWIKTAQKGKPIELFGQGRQKRDYLYINDFIDILLLAAVNKKAVGQIFNIGSGRGLSMRAMARQIVNQLGGKIIYQPWPPEWQAVETGDYISDISKAKKLLGWHPKISFKQGVRQIVIDYQS